MDAQVHTVLSNLPVSDDKLREIATMSDQDPQMVLLKQVIQQGWPELRKHCPPEIIEFWNYRDEITSVDGLMIKGQKLIIPVALRQKM